MPDGTGRRASARQAGSRFSHAFSFRQLPAILQTEAAECGLACLTMIARYFGHDVDLLSMRRRFSTSLKGANLGQLIQIGSQLGMDSRPVRVELMHIAHLKTPCVLHWDLSHFVVLKDVQAKDVIIHDPLSGVRKVSMQELSAHFTGVALELSPRPDFSPIHEREYISLRALAGQVNGIIPALAQILILAAALEVFSLTAPFYLQWVLDQVLVSADRDLLTLLGIGFVLMTIFSSVITAGRSWSVTWLSSTLSVQWSSNLFSHLMRLPLSWFGKRHVGDVVSRFSSIQSIQRTLTTQFIGSLLDGLMSVVTMSIMLLYSVKLTMLVIVIFFIYALARWAYFAQLRRANEEQIIYSARQQSELLESIRGTMSIKLANKQEERLSRYANATVESTNRDVNIQRLTIGLTLTNQLMFGAGRVVIIWIAALLTLKNQLSAGMLIAFVAYADQFTTRSIGLIDKSVDFRMLKLHAERVADIASTPPESDLYAMREHKPSDSTLELRDVGFRYAEGEPWIVRNFNIRLQAGEHVAIVGPSGSGKSTLAKIMLGLIQPEEGQVFFGGVDIRALGMREYRKLVGAVMQDDQMFAGSIAENICFFDASSNDQAIEQAARLAAIHEEIAAMPMGFQSLVGDMGSTLSGGRKQRVILARALYRSPRLLILDEATSHLDAQNERLVNQSIRTLDMTRVTIAHRQETISTADRVIDISAFSE